MNRLILLLVSTLFISSFLSCGNPTDISTQIPENTSGIGVINFPAIKSKALSWDVIYDYLFSDNENGDEQPDWSIDLDRKAYFYTKDVSAGIIIPISDSKAFQKAVKTINPSEPLNENGYSYLRKDQFYIGWKKDVAILSNDTSFLHTGYSDVKSEKITKVKEASQDIFFSFDGEVLGAVQKGLLTLNFNDGEIDINAKGEELIELLEKYVVSGNVKTKKINKTYDASLCLPLKKHNLKEIVLAGMPILQEHGLLFHEQFKLIYPFLDGRVQLGFEEGNVNDHAKKAQLMFGVNPETKNLLDTTFINQFILDKETGVYSDKEDFQFFQFREEYLIFSNTKEKIEFETEDDFVSVDIKRKAIKDDYLFFPKMLLGADAVDNFPINEIVLNSETTDKSKSLMLNLNLKFSNKDKNSLMSVVEYLTSLQGGEEI